MADPLAITLWQLVVALIPTVAGVLIVEARCTCGRFIRSP